MISAMMGGTALVFAFLTVEFALAAFFFAACKAFGRALGWNGGQSK